MPTSSPEQALARPTGRAPLWGEGLLAAALWLLGGLFTLTWPDAGRRWPFSEGWALAQFTFGGGLLLLALSYRYWRARGARVRHAGKWLALLPVLFGLPLVLAPLHIAFLELVIDPACSIVFEAEEGAADLMQQPPRAADEPLLSTRHILLSVLQGSVVTAAVVGLYAWLLRQPAHAATASTAAFVVLVAANAALILPSRSSQTRWRSLWAGLTPVSLWVAGGTLAALAAITTVPWLANAFRFVPLSPLHWFMALLAGLLLTVVFAANKRWLQPTAPALHPSPA